MRFMLALVLFGTSLFAYEPPGTEPIQIRFDQKDLSPQSIPLKMDLTGLDLNDIRLDIRLAGLKGGKHKNCDGMKVGQKGIITIPDPPTKDQPRDGTIEVEVTFGSLGPDKPQFSIATFGYTTLLQEGKKPKYNRMRMNVESFKKFYRAKVEKELAHREDFQKNWEKLHQAYMLRRSNFRDQLSKGMTGKEASDLVEIEFAKDIARFRDMPERGDREIVETKKHLQWCDLMQFRMAKIQADATLYYEAYTIGSAGKTVVGRTAALKPEGGKK